LVTLKAAIMSLNIASALAEIIAWVEPVVGGWRYLFSPTFRARTHQGWRHEHPGYVVWDVFWGMLGIALSLAAAYFLAPLAWRLAMS
jgi:hypothetical protein